MSYKSDHMNKNEDTHKNEDTNKNEDEETPINIYNSWDELQLNTDILDLRAKSSALSFTSNSG